MQLGFCFSENVSVGFILAEKLGWNTDGTANVKIGNKYNCNTYCWYWKFDRIRSYCQICWFSLQKNDIYRKHSDHNCKLFESGRTFLDCVDWPSFVRFVSWIHEHAFLKVHQWNNTWWLDTNVWNGN